MINSNGLVEKIIKEAEKTDPNDFFRRYPPEFLREEMDINLARKIVGSLLGNSFGKNSLYIHIPFCKNKCYFCKYSTIIISSKDCQRGKNILDFYLKLLEREIDLYNVDFKKINFDTLYFGGGTPTILSASQLDFLFDLIYRKFGVKKDAQILMEATPESLSGEKLKILWRRGVNRLTIGIQSFDDRVLAAANRKHTAEEACGAVAAAKKAKIKHVHVDIIIGLPNETPGSCEKAARKLVELSPDSISLYAFDLNPSTIFYKRYRHSNWRYNKKLRMYAIIVQVLEAAGYHVLRSSAQTFVKDVGATNVQFYLRDRQNPVLGIGCGASSQIEDSRSLFYFCVTKDFNKYIWAIRGNALPLKGIRLDLADKMRAYFFWNLYYDRESIKKKFCEKFNKNLDQVFKVEFGFLRKNKIIFDNGDGFSFSKDVDRKEFFVNFIKYFFSDKIKNHCIEYFRSGRKDR